MNTIKEQQLLDAVVRIARALENIEKSLPPAKPDGK